MPLVDIIGNTTVDGLNFDRIHDASDGSYYGWVLSDQLNSDQNKKANSQLLASFLNHVKNSQNNQPSDKNQPHVVTTGNWDGVKINYLSNDTMELIGDGTIKASDAPKKLPFNSDKNDWTLKIDSSDAHVKPVNAVNGVPLFAKSIVYAGNEYVPAHEDFTIWNNFKAMQLSGLVRYQ